MLPWRAVRANCSFAKLVLQAPYSTARTHAPTESYAMSFVYLPIYTPAVPVKPSCKAQWQFFCCCLLFSLFPLQFIPSKLLQHLLQKYYFSIEFSVLSIFWSNHVFTLCILYFCCLAGSHCVLGPQQWPRSFSNYTFSSATSFESLYKVNVSLSSCCSWCPAVNTYMWSF